MKQKPDFNIPLLGRFSEVRGRYKDVFAIGHNAFRVQAGARPVAFDQVAGIVEYLRYPRSRPFLSDEPIGKSAQQRIRPGFVSRRAPHIEAEANRQIQSVLHALSEGGKNISPLVYGEPDNQNPVLGCGE